MGLLPLLVGYGSVLGLLWIAYMILRNLPSSHDPQQPLALFAGFILLMMTPPDLVPSIVAFAVFLVPTTRQSVQIEGSTNSSTKSAISGAGGAE
jgi:hypothetical protein